MNECIIYRAPFYFLRCGVFNVTFVRKPRSILTVLWSQVCMGHLVFLRTFAPKSSYGEIFISPLELVDKVLTPKMKKKMGVTDFVSDKMAVEKCLNFDKSVIITRCSLLC